MATATEEIVEQAKLDNLTIYEQRRWYCCFSWCALTRMILTESCKHTNRSRMSATMHHTDPGHCRHKPALHNTWLTGSTKEEVPKGKHPSTRAYRKALSMRQDAPREWDWSILVNEHTDQDGRMPECLVNKNMLVCFPCAPDTRTDVRWQLDQDVLQMQRRCGHHTTTDGTTQCIP